MGHGVFFFFSFLSFAVAWYRVFFGLAGLVVLVLILQLRYV